MISHRWYHCSFFAGAQIDTILQVHDLFICLYIICLFLAPTTMLCPRKIVDSSIQQMNHWLHIRMKGLVSKETVELCWFGDTDDKCIQNQLSCPLESDFPSWQCYPLFKQATLFLCTYRTASDEYYSFIWQVSVTKSCSCS